MKAFVMVFALGICVTQVANCDDKKDKKDKDEPKVGLALITADGLEVGKDFAKDAKTAMEKYTPKPAPKGLLGGTAVKLHGTIGYTSDSKILLASGNAWMILLDPDGKVDGSGPYVNIDVKSASLASGGTKLVLFKGKITRSEKPVGEK